MICLKIKKKKNTATSSYSLPENTLCILQLPAGVFSCISSSGLCFLADLWSCWWLGYILCSPEDMWVVIIHCVRFIFLCCFFFFNCACVLNWLLCIWEKVHLFSEFKYATEYSCVLYTDLTFFFSRIIILLSGEVSSKVPSQACKLIDITKNSKSLSLCIYFIVLPVWN